MNTTRRESPRGWVDMVVGKHKQPQTQPQQDLVDQKGLNIKNDVLFGSLEYCAHNAFPLEGEKSSTPTATTPSPPSPTRSPDHFTQQLPLSLPPSLSNNKKLVHVNDCDDKCEAVVRYSLEILTLLRSSPLSLPPPLHLCFVPGVTLHNQSQSQPQSHPQPQQSQPPQPPQPPQPQQQEPQNSSGQSFPVLGQNQVYDQQPRDFLSDTLSNSNSSVCAGCCGSATCNHQSQQQLLTAHHQKTQSEASFNTTATHPRLRKQRQGKRKPNQFPAAQHSNQYSSQTHQTHQGNPNNKFNNSQPRAQPNQNQHQHQNHHQTHETLKSTKVSTTSNLSANIFSFLQHVSPCFPAQNPMTLCDIWDCFDKPFGVDMPVMIDSAPTVIAFTPHLSAVQLYARSSSPKISSRLIFEFFEHTPPDMRPPFCDTITKISTDNTAADNPHSQNTSTHPLNLPLSALDPSRSWFCVAWYPIVAQSTHGNQLSGMFLTYHSLNYAQHPFWHLLDTHTTNSPKRAFRSANTQHTANPLLADSESNGSDDVDTSLPARNSNFSAPVVCPHDHSFLRLLGFIPYKINTSMWYHAQIPNSTNNNQHGSVLGVPSNLIRPVISFLDNVANITMECSQDQQHEARTRVFHPDLEHIRRGTSRPGILRNMLN